METRLKGNALTVGTVMLVGVAIVLVVMLLIAWTQGDPTNHRGDHRPPDKTPTSTFPTATSS